MARAAEDDLGVLDQPPRGGGQPVDAVLADADDRQPARAAARHGPGGRLPRGGVTTARGNRPIDSVASCIVVMAETTEGRGVHSTAS